MDAHQQATPATSTKTAATKSSSYQHRSSASTSDVGNKYVRDITQQKRRKRVLQIVKSRRERSMKSIYPLNNTATKKRNTEENVNDKDGDTRTPCCVLPELTEDPNLIKKTEENNEDNVQKDKLKDEEDEKHKPKVVDDVPPTGIPHALSPVEEENSDADDNNCTNKEEVATRESTTATATAKDFLEMEYMPDEKGEDALDITSPLPAAAAAAADASAKEHHKATIEETNSLSSNSIVAPLQPDSCGVHHHPLPPATASAGYSCCSFMPAFLEVQ